MSFGCHVNRDHAPGARPSLVRHIEAAVAAAAGEDFALRAASMFVGGPKTRAITLREGERRELREFLGRTGMRAAAHSVYSAPPWGGDPSAAEFIREEARVCQEAGVAGLVVHLPKLPADAVLRYAARLLDPAAAGVRIFLETPAVTPRESYYETPEKLAALFRGLRDVDPGLARFGLCVDTAHLWTCGVDVQGYAAADAWLRGLEAVAADIPPAAVMYHLNDSKRPRGKGPDAHEALAAGMIWSEYRDDLRESGLQAFVDSIRRHDQVAILERKPNALLLADYRVLREMAAAAPAPAAL